MNHGIFKSHSTRFDQSTDRNKKIYTDYLGKKNIPSTNLKYLGFHSYENFLTEEEKQNLQEYIKCLNMEQREWGATFREGVVIEVDGHKYKPVAIKKMHPTLEHLGKRILDFMRLQHEYRENACFELPEQFDQAYVQKYKPGGELNPHFDERSKFQEIIAGITIQGSSTFVLGLHQAAKASRKMKSGATKQLHVHDARAGQLYVMSGMSRYDFRHAVYNSTDSDRISITFRALAPNVKQKLSVT